MNAINDKLQNIIDNTKGGQFRTVDIERPLKVKKGVEPITKKSTVSIRLGVAYDNIKDVQAKRESGELPAENAGLPWGEWLQYPYVIAHKGEQYLRCSLNKNGNPKPAQYFQNGIEITKEQAQAVAYASEFADKDDMDVFNLKASNIVTVR